MPEVKCNLLFTERHFLRACLQEYEMAHRMFISSRTALMFVLNLHNFCALGERKHEVDVLAEWIHASYAPIADPSKVHVLVVGTRKESVRASDLDHWIEKLRRDLSSRQSPTVFKSWFEPHSDGFSCKTFFVAIENGTTLGDPKGSGLGELCRAITKCAQSLVDTWGNVPLRWLGFLDRLREIESLYLTKKEVMNAGRCFPGFTRSGDDLWRELAVLLVFFRDLGEIYIHEIRSEWFIFVRPEKVLDVLRTIVAPKDRILPRLGENERKKLIMEFWIPSF